MKKTKKLFITTLKLATLTTLGTFPILVASCSNSTKQNDKNSKSEFNLIKANGYSDEMTKLDLGTATLAAGWGDTRVLIKNSNNLVAVGATEIIANDGVQARSNLKRGDVEAIKIILQSAIRDKSNPQLQISDIQNPGKTKFVFTTYSHNDYSSVDENGQIIIDTKGTKVNTYGTPLIEGSDYFDINNGVVTRKENSTNKFKIQFIPSSDPAEVRKASQALEKYLNDKGYNIEISTATEYNAAANALREGSIDVAFLPAGSWAEQAQGTNFILVAGRSVQIIDPYESTTNTTTPAFTDEKILVDAINGYNTFNSQNEKKLYIPQNIENAPKKVDNENGYNEALKTKVDSLINSANGNLPVVGYYRSYIMAKKDSEIALKIKNALETQGSNWTLPWDEVKGLIKFAYTSTTSSGSYIFPEAWFKKHFTGFKSFKGE
ncbi:PhnD/SsuA/transferrin family substrate-binding protein [Mycoplasma sp. CSL10166]|uniref:PhnD/SsuA/transferrin family substrate-binding protein n=1 Tax=Mycoplasma sp. CSL10166 TaxID=2813825 RepID=UPI00197B25D6|nr:PhnD/SsuA/transferrin family substrate-binding protein [Mycoplasma sp. CSL10166]MBN4084094.1 PhnD/SsuA/transferrin family substrate-binding protein [Mycoplasma sp. CSL10166]